MDTELEQAKANVLLVEDNDQEGAYIQKALERLGYTTIWTRSGMEALTIARTQNPDLVLLDVVLKDMDGFSVCRWLKMRAETRDIPVMMLSARTELRDRVEGLHVGANDYIFKPFADEELEARIFAALRIKAAQLELKERNKELESMLHHVEALAITDPLTGLYNRRRFADVLKHQFAVTRRYKNPLSCILLDIDHFKNVNDRHGHDVGDRVLQAVAAKLSESLREVDTAARYGGEEYAVLLPHTSKENALIVAKRLLTVIQELHIVLDLTTLSVTASLGVAASTDLGGKCVPEDLVKAADTALYKAKEGGRNQIVLFDGEM